MRIELSDWQSDFISNPSRFKVAVCGRRSGKTIVDALEIYLQALKQDNSRIWYVAETHSQAKELMYGLLVEGTLIGGAMAPPFFPASIIDKERTHLEKGNITITLKNGSEIRLKGSQNVDALLGNALDLLILDEYQSQKEDVWHKLSPMLADRLGRGIITGTPRGYGNDLYNKWYVGQPSNPEYDPEWYSIQITTLEAGQINPAEIDAYRRRLSKTQFEQEFEANFNNTGQIVYDAYDPVLNHTPKTIADFHPSFPLSFGIDFNLGVMATTVSVIDNAGFTYVIDEIYGEADTMALIRRIQRQYPGRDCHIYPDSNEKTTGISPWVMFEQAGMTVHRNKRKMDSHAFSNPFVQDRINSLNARFCTANGERKLFVNKDKCTRLVKCLTQQGYDKHGEPDKAGGLDHLNDALGYQIYNRFPISGRPQPGRIIVQ